MAAKLSGGESSPVAPASIPPATPSDGRASLAKVAVILGVVALVLGGSAVGIALTHTGPTGPAGTRVSGPIVEQASQEGGIGVSSCADYAGAQIAFAVASGNATITAVVWLEFYHSAGNYTEVHLNIGESTTDCSSDYVLAYVDASQPTGTLETSATLVRGFSTTIAGPYTFYVNTELYYQTGSDSVAIEKCTTVGVFYPS